jgi:hypothetical protein
MEWMGKIKVKGDYQSYLTAITYLKGSRSAGRIIKELEQASETYTIFAVDHVEDRAFGKGAYWDPHEGLCVKDGLQSAAIGLLHELIHIWQEKNKLPRYKITKDGLFELYEEQATAMTNPASRELGEPERHGYYDAGKDIRTILPIPLKPGDGKKSCECKGK